MRRLAATDIEVFPLCLGGNVFGWTIDERRSFEVLDAFVAGGGNFIDTADVYGWSGSGVGASEEIIGRWIAARGNRDQLVIATKVGSSPELRGLSHATITAGIDASLGRLGIETVDLYYAHVDDPDTPLDETLGAFAELIAAGKIRHAGASNYGAERLEQAMRLGAGLDMASYAALQPQYNLLERDYERELEPVCARDGLACVPYFGLARGFLSGKYREGGAEVDSQRAAEVRKSYFNERGFRGAERPRRDRRRTRDVRGGGVAGVAGGAAHGAGADRERYQPGPARSAARLGRPGTLGGRARGGCRARPRERPPRSGVHERQQLAVRVHQRQRCAAVLALGRGRRRDAALEALERLGGAQLELDPAYGGRGVRGRARSLRSATS